MICLNGKWETGLNRNYDRVSNVPGIIYPANTHIDGSLWYRKEITLPEGDWEKASIYLYGAKYLPEIYINGDIVSREEGGLTVTRHLLSHPDVKPGNKVTVEIKLASLADVPNADASKLPKADRWRSDLSSHIWNDMYLDVHNSIRIDSVVTAYDDKNDALEIRYKTSQYAKIDETITFVLYDKNNEISRITIKADEKGSCKLPLNGKCKLWTCDEPNLYTLKTMVDGAVREQKIGLKSFRKNGLGFELNGNPITLKMGSVCWHRWQRDEQALEIAYDENWFLNNILLPLKKNGANTLRFHLGPAPERFMELCDEYGMLVQAEWSFFHGLEAGSDSLKEQWANWLDMILCHVGVAVVHPWNEINNCQQLSDAQNSLEYIIKDYPEFILAHRDVLHLHKYWWSMFENVGLYYDNKEQFGETAIADEFGGNYLDYEYNTGKYPAVASGLKRFLGMNHTKEDRIWLQNVSHSKIAEYWRRMGIGGFSPFCMISSPEDGNTYYEGNLADGKFKPVWNELKAAYMPVSVSMNIWDRNFYPCHETEIELYLFNDTGKDQEITCSYGISGETNIKEFSKLMKSYSRDVVKVTYKMPENPGEYTMYASVGEAVSKWDIIVTDVVAGEISKKVGVLPCETELIEFCRKYDLEYTNNIENADVFVGLEKTYNTIKTDKNIRKAIENLVNSGKSAALFGVGPKLLGEGYSEIKKENFQSARLIKSTDLEKVELINGISLEFKEFNEPESCVQQTESCNWLWENLNKKAMWMWNGLKGGLIVPAADMAIVGGDKESFEKLWKSKRADIAAVKEHDYYAYELEGFYEYSDEYDEAVKAKLKERVTFLVDDAPSLQGAVNPDAEITVLNLHEEYHELPDNAGKVKYFDASIAGKSLLRTPSVLIDFADKGNMLISQFMLDGRLANENDKIFELKNDPAATQLLINTIKNI